MSLLDIHLLFTTIIFCAMLHTLVWEAPQMEEWERPNWRDYAIVSIIAFIPLFNAVVVGFIFAHFYKEIRHG